MAGNKASARCDGGFLRHDPVGVVTGYFVSLRAVSDHNTLITF
jgi:hypothetical protein